MDWREINLLRKTITSLNSREGLKEEAAAPTRKCVWHPVNAEAFPLHHNLQKPPLSLGSLWVLSTSISVLITFGRGKLLLCLSRGLFSTSSILLFFFFFKKQNNKPNPSLSPFPVYCITIVIFIIYCYYFLIYSIQPGAFCSISSLHMLLFNI